MKSVKFVSIQAPLLWCLVLILFNSCSCSDDPVVENPFRWDNEMLPMSIDPFYYDGTYFAFPTDFENGIIYMAGLDELTGDTVFYREFADNLPFPSLSSKIFFDEGEVMFQLDRYIFHIDPSSGNTNSIDTFPNFVWNSYKTDEYFTGCSYNSSLNFYYYEFQKKNGAYKINVLYLNDLDQGEQLSGAPPFKSDDGWLLHTNNRFTSSNYESCIVLIQEDTIKTCDLFGSDNPSFNIYEFQDSYIMYRNNNLFSIDKIDLSINWEIPSTSSNGLILDDKLYVLASSEAALEEGLLIIDLEAGSYESIESNPSLGNLKTQDHQIPMIQYGQFRVFNTVKKDWDFVSESIQSRTGYQPHFGISPNSVLFWDIDGWHCFPY
jgi:hypothetical protein